MIQVMIEMDPATGTLNIKSDVPPLITLGVVTAAYHELLSQKVQWDIKAQTRIIEPPRPGGAVAPTRPCLYCGDPATPGFQLCKLCRTILSFHDWFSEKTGYHQKGGAT